MIIEPAAPHPGSRIRGTPELVSLRPPGVSSRFRVEQAVQIIESLAEVGSLKFEHLHVRDIGALIVVYDDNPRRSS
jgi:hypothetical protein